MANTQDTKAWRELLFAEVLDSFKRTQRLQGVADIISGSPFIVGKQKEEWIEGLDECSPGYSISTRPRTWTRALSAAEIAQEYRRVMAGATEQTPAPPELESPEGTKRRLQEKARVKIEFERTYPEWNGVRCVAAWLVSGEKLNCEYTIGDMALEHSAVEPESLVRHIAREFLPRMGEMLWPGEEAFVEAWREFNRPVRDGRANRESTYSAIRDARPTVSGDYNEVSSGSLLDVLKDIARHCHLDERLRAAAFFRTLEEMYPRGAHQQDYRLAKDGPEKDCENGIHCPNCHMTFPYRLPKTGLWHKEEDCPNCHGRPRCQKCGGEVLGENRYARCWSCGDMPNMEQPRDEGRALQPDFWGRKA